MAAAPAINGRWEQDRVAISPTIDIGVGTALGDKGLVVPVVKNAGALTLAQIGERLDDLFGDRDAVAGPDGRVVLDLEPHDHRWYAAVRVPPDEEGDPS